MPLGLRKKSLEHLFPSHDADERRNGIKSTTFSLISTIVGGGLLSVPFAFKRAGIIGSFGAILLCSAASDFTAYILVSSSRRSGGQTYEQVVFLAFGRVARAIVMLLLFCLLMLTCVAYIILLSDLLVSLLQLATGHNYTDDKFVVDIVKCSIAVAVLPLSLQRKLEKLKFASVMAVLSVIVLTTALVARAVSQHGFHMPGLTEEEAKIKWFPDNVQDFFFSFPVFAVSFLCHFNVLPAHTELIRPTRRRFKKVFHRTMGACAFLYCVAGFFGYLYARSATCGDITQNFSSKDWAITCGRVALSITLFLSFPLLVLPCRLTLHRAISSVLSGSDERDRTLQSAAGARAYPDSPSDVRGRGGNGGSFPASPLLFGGHGDHGEVEDWGEGDGVENDEEWDPTVGDDTAIESSTLSHFGETIFIVGAALGVALCVESIVVVWTFMGSSVSLLIAFTLPCASYLKIRSHKGCNIRKVLAWIILVVPLLTGVFSTYESVLHAGDVTKPKDLKCF